MENIDSDRGDSVKIIDRTILALHPVSIGILSLSLQPIHTPFESNRIWNITEYSEFLINHPLGVPGGISGLVSARVPGGCSLGLPWAGCREGMAGRCPHECRGVQNLRPPFGVPGAGRVGRAASVRVSGGLVLGPPRG